MSGETEEQPFGWTFDSLFRHLVALTAESALRYEDRFASQEAALKAAFESATKALDASFKAHDSLHVEMTTRLNERFESQQRAVELALHEHDARLGDRIEGTGKHLEALIEAHARAHLEEHKRVDVLNQNIAAAMVEARNAHEQVHELSNVAITKAEQSNEKRFESVNAFRTQLSDQARDLMARREADVRFAAIEEKVSDYNDRFYSRINDIAGEVQGMRSEQIGARQQRSGLASNINLAYGAIGLLLVVVTIVVANFVTKA